MKRVECNGLELNWLAGVVLGVALGIGWPSASHAQPMGASISSEGAEPNANAMLDVQSPATGTGKGLLVPRITENQRTNASAAMAGGLLGNTGDLRGGAAQGLIVYQTDGSQGFYYNTSTTATPAWSYIGDSGGGDFMANGSVPMIGALNLGGQRITNVSTVIEFAGSDITVGRLASATNSGLAMGYMANGSSFGATMGYQANGFKDSVALGYRANGHGSSELAGGGVAIGHWANSYAQQGTSNGGVAVGYYANARMSLGADNQGAVAVGNRANSYVGGAALGYNASAYYQAVSVGHRAWIQDTGVALGYRANAFVRGIAVGYFANSGNQNYSVAKGGYSRCTRYNEEWKGADTLSLDPTTDRLTGYNKYGYGQANWYGVTLTAAATELYLGTSGRRFVLQDTSVVAFKVLVVAVNTTSVTGDSSVWEISGTIKRRLGAGTTALVGANVTTMENEQGALTTNPTLTADTTNGALKLTVTGVASATVRWNAMATYSEVRE